ncbi:class I SAM-dependent methyltransferase [Silicimonas algicola]|uniref:Methyltransferase family protein n=2 Tax=Silicimonas algicola TaxID=1826607 RepID=A0A316GF87_9RHOB|nr:class I SAM-dependent methyltransferase [Silicimonas algicola]PWK58626.1 methyltransferase family protein [Silicimonas algicola]
MERRWLDAFVAAMPNDGGRVLDLGCGNGVPMARYLIERGCGVTGVDGSASMIGQARKALPGAEWIVGDMRRLQVEGPFGGILAWHSLFHLPRDDQRALLARLETLALPRAALMFTSGTEDGEVLGRLEGEALYHASLDTAEYRDILDLHGFDILEHVVSDPDCGGATVWLAGKRAD